MLVNRHTGTKLAMSATARSIADGRTNTEASRGWVDSRWQLVTGRVVLAEKASPHERRPPHAEGVWIDADHVALQILDRLNRQILDDNGAPGAAHPLTASRCSAGYRERSAGDVGREMLEPTAIS